MGRGKTGHWRNDPEHPLAFKIGCLCGSAWEDAAHDETYCEPEDPEELASLENVERLLRDCRDLLEDNSTFAASPSPEDQRLTEEDGSEGFGSSFERRDGYPAAA